MLMNPVRTHGHRRRPARRARGSSAETRGTSERVSPLPPDLRSSDPRGGLARGRLALLDLVFFKNVDDLLELVLAMLDLMSSLQDTFTMLVDACIQT